MRLRLRFSSKLARLLLPVISAANGLPNRLERPPVNNLGGSWQLASSISRPEALDRVGEWSVSS
jgi:hypothetical protein